MPGIFYGLVWFGLVVLGELFRQAVVMIEGGFVRQGEGLSSAIHLCFRYDCYYYVFLWFYPAAPDIGGCHYHVVSIR